MKSIRQVILTIGAAMVLPYLIVGAFGGGPNSAKTLQAGLLMIPALVALAAWAYWRRNKMDDDDDEREDYLLLRAMAFGFYVMIAAVMTYFLWPATSPGTTVDATWWLVGALWGSVVVGYVYNRVRH